MATHEQADRMMAKFDTIQPTVEDLEIWGILTETTRDKITVELTFGQWAALFATLRGGAVYATKPGLAKLVHDEAYKQVIVHTAEGAQAYDEQEHGTEVP